MTSNTAKKEVNIEKLGLSDEETQFISELQEQKFYPKGTIIVSEGQHINKCFHVVKGCIRKFHLKDGEEKTTDFFFETDSISTNPSGTNNLKSKFYLDCVEDTTVTSISIEQEKLLYSKFPRFQSMCRISTEIKLEEYQEMFSNFIASSPEERYLNIMNTKPELLSRVPQYQLASYLGVKPESLSRIRKRLMA